MSQEHMNFPDLTKRSKKVRVKGELIYTEGKALKARLEMERRK